MKRAYTLGIEDFGVVIADNIRDSLGDDHSVEYKAITKNNGVVHHAVIIRRNGDNIAPTVYLEAFYDKYLKGIAVERLSGDIVRFYQNSLSDQDIDVSFFLDFSKVCEMLTFRAVNYEKNKKIIENVPYKRFEDLAFIPICVVNTIKDSGGSVTINRNHLKVWEISEDELWENILEHAADSRPVYVAGIEEFVGKRIGVKMDGMIPNVFVVSNDELCYGASAVFYPGVLTTLADKMQSDVIIIPSSVHETIVMPSSGSEEVDSRLVGMVQEVNETVLSSEDILSNSVYCYRAKEDRIVRMAPDSEG